MIQVCIKRTRALVWGPMMFPSGPRTLETMHFWKPVPWRMLMGCGSEKGVCVLALVMFVHLVCKVDKQKHMLYNLYFWTDEKSTLSGVVCLIAWLIVCLLDCLCVPLLSQSAFTNPPISGYILFHLRNGEASKLPAPFPDVQSPLRKRSACFALSNEQLELKKCSFQNIKSSSLRKGKQGFTKHQFWGAVSVVRRLHHWKGWRISPFLRRVSEYLSTGVKCKDQAGGFLLR